MIIVLKEKQCEMKKWISQIACFFSSHVDVREKCVYLFKNRVPVVSYEGIPKDAQVHARVRLGYITDLWEEHFTCSRCGKKRIQQNTKHDYTEYNQMIYLENGRCYLVHPKLFYETRNDQK